MNAGPQPGEKILLIGSEEDKDIVELLCLIPRFRKLQITTVMTAGEAIGALAQSFDWAWLHLPLPDLSASHLLEDILTTPDLAGRVGSESPLELLERLTTSPTSWYTKLSQQTWKIPLKEEGFSVRDIVMLHKQSRRKIDGQWLWIRMSTDKERAWVIQLLERNMTHDDE